MFFSRHLIRDAGKGVGVGRVGVFKLISPTLCPKPPVFIEKDKAYEKIDVFFRRTLLCWPELAL